MRYTVKAVDHKDTITAQRRFATNWDAMAFAYNLSAMMCPNILARVEVFDGDATRPTCTYAGATLDDQDGEG